MSNVRVLGFALADFDGTSRFAGAGSSLTFKMAVATSRWRFAEFLR